MVGAPFDDRFDALYAVAYRVAFRIVGGRQDAEDVAQEACVRACMRWDRIEGNGEAWVATTAARLAIDWWRRRSRAERPFPLVVSRPAPAVDAATEERMLLASALRHLPSRQREVVVLRYVADLPEAAVAEALGCSYGAVKQHAHRGIAALRTRLQNAGEG